MMISGATEINTIFYPERLDSLPAVAELPEIHPEVLPIEIKDADYYGEDEFHQDSFNAEEFLLKLPEVPLEVRLNQVMNLEDIQTLLLMRSPYQDKEKQSNQFYEVSGSNFDSKG